MSKKKDRLNTDYRFCPYCGRKTIHVDIIKHFFRKKETFIDCWYCYKITKIC